MEMEPVRKEFDFRDRQTIARKPLADYIPKAIQRVERDHSRMGFVEGVFDLLSRGQYVTANIAEDITQLARGEGLKSWDAPILRGLTGKRKGNWENVLWGSREGAEEEQEGWFKTQNKVVRGATGFLANVLFDPLTYMTFGATSAARQTAHAAAEGAVRRAAGRGQRASKEVAEGLGTGAQAREMSRTYNDAYRAALRDNSGKVKGDLVDELRSDREVVRSRLGSESLESAERETLQKRMTNLDDELGKLGDGAAGGPRDDGDYFQSLGLGHAGERSTRFMGMNIPGTVSQRAPNFVSKQFIEIGDMIRNTKAPGQEITFADAWWRRMNTGAIGSVRRNFGFRDPYQRAVREIELSNAQSADVDQMMTLRELDGTLGNYTPEEHTAVVDLMVRAEDFSVRQADQKRVSVAELLDNPEFRSQLDPSFGGEDEQRLLGLYSDTRRVLDEWSMTEQQKALDGLVKEGAHREIYLPLVAKMKRGAGNKAGSFEASPTQQRNKTHAFSREQEAARMSFMTGISHDEALDAVAKGKGIVVTDLTEMLSIRAQVHQKIMARANIVEKLREFGVKVDTLRAPPGAAPDSVEHLNMAKEAMKRKEGLEEVGLYTIDDPATEGWLFDAEVHDVLGRLLKVTESEESIQALRKHMGAYTGWWKSVVTTSPGFHVQNTWSNGLTLFHRLGPEAFDPRRWEEAFAATAETIGAGVGMGTEAVRKAVGSNNRLQRTMGKEINGYTLRELADYAHRNGIINEFAAQVG